MRNTGDATIKELKFVGAGNVVSRWACCKFMRNREIKIGVSLKAFVRRVLNRRIPQFTDVLMKTVTGEATSSDGWAAGNVHK